MSWASLASNQTVSFNNLQNAVNNGVFTAKTSIPASNEQITKEDANTYARISTSYSPYAALAQNQLVTKSDLIAPVCTLAGIIDLPAPLPVFGLGWETTNTSFAQCPGSEWVITNNNQSIRYNISNSANCGGTCNQIQAGTATATITVGSSNVNMALDFDGLVEWQDAGFERMTFKLNGTQVARGESKSAGQLCVMGAVQKVFTTSPPYLLLANTTYTFLIEFTTGDALYHNNAFYQVNLGFTVV